MRPRPTLLLPLVLVTACLSGPAPPPGGRTTFADGARLYHRTWTPEPPAGPEAIVVPGASWLEADLSGRLVGRRVVFYDLRGRGRSDPAPDPSALSLESDLADLEELRSVLGIERMTLVGWSYQAGLAVRYALRYPEHVAGLILIGALPPRRAPHWDAFLQRLAERLDRDEFARLEALRASGVPERDPAAFCRAFTRAYVRAYAIDPGAVARMRSDPCVPPNLDPDVAGALGRAIVGGLGAWDWREELAHVETRVLLVHGRGDVVPLDGSIEYAAFLPNARLLVVEGAGHLPWLERPDVFFPAVDVFLEGGWPPAATVPAQ